MTHKDTLADWLRDAYAMEREALDIMSTQVERVKNYPDIAERLREHIDETESQANRLEACLKQLGTDTSATKTGAARLMGMMQSAGHSFSSDEIVKNAMADYAFENFEISAYKSLIAAAEVAGEPEVRRVCEQNLREEEAMAAWLGERLSPLTREYMIRAEEGGTSDAKR